MAPKPSVWQKRTRAIFKSAFAKALSFFHAVYRKLSWENLQAAVNASASKAIKLVWIATSILVVGFVVRDLSTDLVTIEPISVPKLFSENGYTPEVASRRLRDAVNDYAAKAGTWMKSPSIAPRDELPNIIVPKIDLSLDTVVSSIRNLLHYGNRRSISGELVLRKNAVWLNLRVDGQRVYSSPSGFDSENPDELLAAAVPALVEQIRPYLVASTLYNDDPARGAQKADDIIARFLVSDVNVLWAHILKGQFLIEEKKDYLQAETVLRRAISLDKANPVAHNNLGLTLNFQGKHDEAMAEYQYAIKLDSKYALPHYNLGNILRNRDEFKRAIAEYRHAIRIDPKNARPHHNLGFVLNSQGDLDGAMAEYRHAIELNPKDPRPHIGLGIVFDKRSEFIEAIAEYRRAIEIDPTNTDSHNNLGVSLNKQDKIDEAIAEYHRAIELDPNNLIASDNLKKLLSARSSAK